MKRKISSGIAWIALSLSIFLLAGCSERDVTIVNGTPDIKQMVQDYSSGKITNQSASITSRQLIVTSSNEKKVSYDLPENDFFVSIAPYIEETHPCAIHSLTGCRGEMAEKEFSVYIEDIEGNRILDQTLKSQSNGFIDLWLPRESKYRIKIVHEGKTADSEFSTFDGDNTCITTIRLS